MIDSETCRLLLRHYRVAHEEEPHAFIWGSVLSLARAGSAQVPALCGAGLRLAGPDAMVERWDVAQLPGRALIPPDPAMAAIARRDWGLFHGTLADCTARLAYYHLLPHRDVMVEPFTRGIPHTEAIVARAAYPAQRATLSLLLRLSRKTADSSLAQIGEILDATDRRVVDGRLFLQNDRITLGDIALAAAVAPVTLPDGNQSPVPRLDDMPADYAAIVREVRRRPTAGFVQRLYEAVL